VSSHGNVVHFDVMLQLIRLQERQQTTFTAALLRHRNVFMILQVREILHVSRIHPTRGAITFGREGVQAQGTQQQTTVGVLRVKVIDQVGVHRRPEIASSAAVRHLVRNVKALQMLFQMLVLFETLQANQTHLTLHVGTVLFTGSFLHRPNN
jgi:hypothetical protein